MPNPVAHFEIYGDDPQKLAGFYERLFGWAISAVPGMEYWLIRTVATDPQGAPVEAGGINGGLMKRPQPESRAWLNYVTVVRHRGRSRDERLRHLAGRPERRLVLLE